jgi:hypothetical protein
MTYKPYADKLSLWTYLRHIPGVLYLNGCKRTADLGKWNLSTTKQDYGQVRQWIDDHIQTLFKNLPKDIQGDSASINFPIPRCLSSSVRSPHATSISSSTSFNQGLAARMKPPLSSLSNAPHGVLLSQYPPLPTTSRKPSFLPCSRRSLILYPPRPPYK